MWLTVALVPAVGVVVDLDDAGAEDLLVGAEEEDAEDAEDEADDSGAELEAELELELDSGGVNSPILEPGSLLEVVSWAAALYAARLFAPDGGLITATMPP